MPQAERSRGSVRDRRVAGGLVIAVLVGGSLVWVLRPDSSASGPAHITLPKASCGVVFLDGNQLGRVHEQPAGAMACFHEAAALCHAAGVELRANGVDSGTDAVIELRRSGSRCTAHVSENNSVDGGIMRHSSRFDCDQVQVADDQETVTCPGGARFVVPATPPTPQPTKSATPGAGSS